MISGDLMYLIFVLIVWTIFGIVFVDWKRWKEYYPTIQYYCILNILYDFLYYNHTLWAFRAITTNYLNHTIISIAFYFIVIPITLLIFLQRYPGGTFNRARYIFVWSLFYWAIEFLYTIKDMFVYDNGWNIWHSLWFNLLMFTMIRLHYKRPLLTLCLTIAVVPAFMWFFPVPLSSMK